MLIGVCVVIRSNTVLHTATHVELSYWDDLMSTYCFFGVCRIIVASE